MHQFLKMILFCISTLHVSDGLSAHHQKSKIYIEHQVYVIQVLWLLASKQPQNLYGMMLCVQS